MHGGSLNAYGGLNFSARTLRYLLFYFKQLTYVFYQYNCVLFIKLESLIFAPDSFSVLTVLIANVLSMLFAPIAHYLIIVFICSMLLK